MDAALGTFEVDPDKVRDILSNLLANAVQFSPDGATIRLEARRIGDDAAELVVADEGIGLGADELRHLFQPFYTEIDPSRHGGAPGGFGRRGMGLGLALVKRFVALHGGAVDVRSEPGRGSTFTVRLPRHPCPAAPHLVHSTAAPAGPPVA